MPAFLVTGPQNSPFLPQQWPKPSAILCAYQGGMARLSGPDSYDKNDQLILLITVSVVNVSGCMNHVQYNCNVGN